MVDPFAKLKNAFPRQYPRWRVCFENARLSYRLYPNDSISLPYDPRVIRFKAFIDRRILKYEQILDIGCGPLGLPGYLSFRDPITIDGVDVIDYSESFSGTFHQASAEFLPFPGETIHNVVVGTSIDHCINLNKAFNEIHRVLKPGGHLITWSRHHSPWYRIQQWLYITWNNRYVELPPHTIFYVPPFAPDQFHHKYLTLRTILRTAKKNGLRLVRRHEYDSRNVFLCFRKKEYR